MNHQKLDNKYKEEKGFNSTYRKLNNNTLVYDEQYVHWLQDYIVNNLKQQ